MVELGGGGRGIGTPFVSHIEEALDGFPGLPVALEELSDRG